MFQKKSAPSDLKLIVHAFDSFSLGSDPFRFLLFLIIGDPSTQCHDVVRDINIDFVLRRIFVDKQLRHDFGVNPCIVERVPDSLLVGSCLFDFLPGVLVCVLRAAEFPRLDVDLVLDRQTRLHRFRHIDGSHPERL